MNEDMDAQFLCKDCARYNLCEYYHRRKKDSYICKYFHLSETQKTGHWKPYLKEGLRYQCSACDSRFDTPWEYCPNCGAKMVEPQESEEKEKK